MRAVLIEEFGRPPVVTDVPEPVAPDDGVVVEVEATGLCRSDWHGWVGHDPDISLPHVPGHELAGTVVDAGSLVRRWHVGQRVTVPFVCGCGRCEFCLRGDAQVCPNQVQPGFTHWGSFAERVALHHADVNLVALPEGLGADAAASLGCRFATAFRAVVGRANVKSGEWVAVLGCGGVGLSALMIARALGARVVAVDVGTSALRRARSLGAEVTIDAGALRSGAVHGPGIDGPGVDGPGVGLPATVVAATGGGAHVAIDAAGSEQSCTDSILSLRRRGRHVQVGLLPSSAGRTGIPWDRVIGYELDLLGSHGMAAADYPGMLALVTAGRLDPQALVARTIGLAMAATELPRMTDHPSNGITIVDPRR